MDEISITGGARIGHVNASWPLAKLSVTAQRLKISGFVLGNYEFAQGDVVSIERYGSIPVLARGIRIVHTRRDYPSSIVFWCLRKPEKLIEQIRATGFAPGAPANAVIPPQEFPLRWTVVLSFILIWNVLFLLDQNAQGGIRALPGPLTLAGLVALFLICWGTRVSPPIQRLVLREGHVVTEAIPYLQLFQVIAAFLLIIFSLMMFVQ